MKRGKEWAVWEEEVGRDTVDTRSRTPLETVVPPNT